MAFKHGKGAKFKLNAIDLSAYIDNVEFSRSKDASETTTFGDSARDFIEGLRNSQITIGGKWDGAQNAADDRLNTVYTSTATVAFKYNPTGADPATVNDPHYTGNCWMTDLRVTSPVEGVTVWTATLQVDGAITRDTSSAW